MSESELLPCPFCGGEAEIEGNDPPPDDREWFTVACTKCNVLIDRDFDDDYEARVAWNRRPSPTRAGDDATVERVARALLERRGFGFYTDPMEGGQDAYDITMEAIEDARTAIAALAPEPPK